jgi:hypothetical protein
MREEHGLGGGIKCPAATVPGVGRSNPAWPRVSREHGNRAGRTARNTQYKSPSRLQVSSVLPSLVKILSLTCCTTRFCSRIHGYFGATVPSSGLLRERTARRRAQTKAREPPEGDSDRTVSPSSLSPLLSRSDAGKCQFQPLGQGRGTPFRAVPSFQNRGVVVTARFGARFYAHLSCRVFATCHLSLLPVFPAAFFIMVRRPRCRFLWACAVCCTFEDQSLF